MVVKAYGTPAGDQPLAPLNITRRAVGAHDVQIEILYCGICHSDLHQARGEWAGTLYPCVPGHEIVGRVAVVGGHARARPPEDVGGPWSYGDFLETILDPQHEDHKAHLRWAGGHFDPEWFDLDVINKDLRNTFRSNVSRRLHQPKPKTTSR